MATEVAYMATEVAYMFGYNEMAVDYKFVEKLQDELMCSICRKVLNEPQMVNCCEQRFCKNCLTKWMTNNKTCPHCRSTDFNHILLKGLSKRISELKVYCANKAHGCKSTLKVSEYQHHLSMNNAQGCFFTKLPCPIQCGADLFRGDLHNHCKAKCPKRRVQCQYCKSEGEYQMITGGHKDTCPCYPLACPQTCGAEVLRKDLTAHQGVCPLELVPCPFSDICCKVKVPRQDLDKHIQSSMLQHVTGMALSHTALKLEHVALKKDYTELRESNRAKMKATALFLQGQSNEYASTITVAQLNTLLVDTSTVERGSALRLILVLSEGNIKSGHHYIILEGYKFKLEWERQQHREELKQLQGYREILVTPYIITLHSMVDETYPVLSTGWSSELKIYLSGSIQTISISHGTPAALGSIGGGDQLLGSVTLDCDSNITAPTLAITIM